MIANAIISFSTGVKLHDYGCSLKVFRAEVVKSMRLYGEMHRFLPAIAAEQGVEIVEHIVNHRRRHARQVEVRHLAHRSGGPGPDDRQVPQQLFHASAADVRRPWPGPGICRHRDLCLHGVFEDRLQPGHRQPSVAAAWRIADPVGIKLVMMGLLGEMQARTYHESQNKPIYVIREILETPRRRATCRLPHIRT